MSGFVKRQMPLAVADALGESRAASAACCATCADPGASFTSVTSMCSTSGSGSAPNSARGCCAAANADPAAALPAAFAVVDEALHKVGRERAGQTAGSGSQWRADGEAAARRDACAPCCACWAAISAHHDRPHSDPPPHPTLPPTPPPPTPDPPLHGSLEWMCITAAAPRWSACFAAAA